MLKDSWKIVNEIVTLGGAGRLEEAKHAYQEKYDEYQCLYQEAQGYQSDIENNINAIGVALTQAKSYLEKSERLIEANLKDKREFNINIRTEALEKVAQFNTGFESAINIGAGTIAGGTLAVGSWGLVMALGSASTGASIAGLSGVAATNATLAWFGGGALAAGGAGMAGGAAVLGGLFAIPLVYFAAKGTHKKARELEEAKTELVTSIAQLHEQIPVFKTILETVQEKSTLTSLLCNNFISDFIRNSQQLRPHGIFSAIKQKFRSLLGLPPYTQEQLLALERITQSVTEFLDALGGL